MSVNAHLWARLSFLLALLPFLALVKPAESYTFNAHTRSFARSVTSLCGAWQDNRPSEVRLGGGLGRTLGCRDASIRPDDGASGRTPSAPRGSGRSRSVSSRSPLSMKASLGEPPPYPVRVAVMGGGNFGIALASVLGRKGIPVTLLVRKETVASHINKEHCHPKYMSDITLPPTLRATSDPATALSDATYVVHAVPVQYSRDFLMEVRDHIPPGVPVLSGSKGIETTSLGFMADILNDCLGEDRSYAFLSGPSFAREICEDVATAVVVASKDSLLADDLADLFSNENFRVFTSKDVIGVEVGGAVKNVIALSAGMCEGLGLGTNAMSGLVTRGCAEMRRLGKTYGARPSTLAGLSGKTRGGGVVL